MHSAVNPKPVDAILDTVRVSLPAASARSFTCPVVGSACSQKKRNPAFSLYSSSRSSVPGYPPPGAVGERDRVSLRHPKGKNAQPGSVEMAAILHSCTSRCRLVRSIFNVPSSRFLLEGNTRQLGRLIWL